MPYDLFSLEAFIATSVLMDMMNRIPSPITREKIVTQLESLDHEKIEGLTLTFNPETRSLARYVWIETEQEEPWIQKKISKNM